MLVVGIIIASILQVLAILFITLQLTGLQQYHESTFTNYKPTVDIVISRYNESLDWLCAPIIANHIKNPANKTTIYIYNKGINNVTAEFMRCYQSTIVDLHVVEVPNVGRCDHTYLYHIIKMYDDLADVTVFLPASCEMDSKVNKSWFVVANACTSRDTVFVNEHPGRVIDTVGGFKLDRWISGHGDNSKVNKDDSMELANPRPFKAWFEKVFTGPDRDAEGITYSAIFAMSRKDILNRSRTSYGEIIKHVNTHNNPEAGHYIERSWAAIFYPVSNDRMFNNGYGQQFKNCEGTKWVCTN